MSKNRIFVSQPFLGIRKAGEKPDCWEAPSGRGWFDISMVDGIFPSGWVLLQGSLVRRGGDYVARFQYDLGKGFVESQFFEIPASGKGVINEVICFPSGIRRMRFSPMGTAGEFELGTMTITKVGAVTRRWRMMHRVITTIFLHPKRKRKLIRLNLFRMLVDLKGTYGAAGKLLAHAPAPDYASWIARFDSIDASDYQKIKKVIDRFAYCPHFHLLLLADDVAQGGMQKTLDSLSNQIYSAFTCVILNGNTSDSSLERGINSPAQVVEHIAQDHVAAWLKQFNVALAGKRAGEWVMLLRAGDVLAPHALYWFASEALANPGAAVVYSDDDSLDMNYQRRQPRFKPDWSLAHFRSTNFVGNAVALRGSEVVSAGGVNLDCFRYGNYDLLLRVVDAVGDAGAAKVAHIPSVLLHRMIAPPSGGKRRGSDGSHWNMDALRAHLARNGVIGEVSEILPECWRVRYQLPEVPPLVSIIVPTRDEPTLLKQCVESILAKTAYPELEILVVDNQSADGNALAYLEQLAGRQRVRLLKYDLPFNYSAMNNMAVRAARGAVICLLNNDTEVISPDWLQEMVGCLLQPEVGVVGAKLYFPSGQVQHGGDLVGVGTIASHAHVFLQRDDPGYCNRAAVAQEFSAVTAACMIVRRSLYEELGGLDERHLPVAFNDVDFCLRARESGYRVVWTPHAELYHHEKVSRGKDRSAEGIRRERREVNYMLKRWRHMLNRDPFYNPNLSHERPDFSLSNAPMIERPWLF
jgi:GT2 family glycosyltransferase